MGGPYAKQLVFSDDHLKDGWGQPFQYTCPESTRTEAGVSLTVRTGQIVSAGPDSVLGTADDIRSDAFHDRGHLFLTITQGGADNIVFPFHPPASTGTVFVSVIANRIPDPLGATAKLYSPVNGEQAVTSTQKNLPTSTTFDGFVFGNVVQGQHVLVVAHTGAIGDTTTCVTVTRTVPITVHGGQQVVKEVRLLTTADVKVTENPCTIPD